MRMFDFVGFVVPQEGSFISIENLCIPKPSTKEDQVYRLINYLYTPKSAASHYHTFGFFPSTTDVTDHLEIDPLAESLFKASQDDFSKYHFLENILPQQETRDIWVEVKSGG
jgi:spermidine/putrescine transport system substrate-binding protein